MATEHVQHEAHYGHRPEHGGHGGSHIGHSFKKRFWKSLLFALSSLIFFYGGYPFLKGFLDELKARRPVMMTLIAIAIGAGTDVAVETADIIFVKSNPQDVVAMIGLARATYRKMVQNLAWATGYNAIAMPLAAGVLYGSGILLSPALGAVFMSLSTILVAINARLLKLRVVQIPS